MECLILDLFQNPPLGVTAAPILLNQVNLPVEKLYIHLWYHKVLKLLGEGPPFPVDVAVNSEA